MPISGGSSGTAGTGAVSSRESAAAFGGGAEAILGFRSMSPRAWEREAWSAPGEGIIGKIGGM